MSATKKTDGPVKKVSSCAWSGTSDEEPLYKSEEVPFKLTYLFLGSVGIVPCTWKKPHLLSIHPTKSTLVIGIAFAAASFVGLFRGVSFYIHRILNEDIPLRVKTTISIYLAFCFYSTICVSVWFDVPTIRQTTEISIRLSKLYFELTKRRPRMPSKTIEKITIVLSLFVPLPVLAIIKDIQPELNLEYEYILPFVLLAITVFPLAELWAGHCYYITRFAKDVNQELAQSVQQKSMTSEKMRIYRDIWIELKAFSDNLSKLNTFFLLLVLTLPTLMIGAFALILYVQDGLYFVGTALLFFCVTIVLLIGWLGVSTDSTIDELKILYTAVLSIQDLSSIKTGTQSQIINMYLMENLRPVHPTFSGFLAVTKYVIPSMLSAVTMNVVILAQLTQPQTSQ